MELGNMTQQRNDLEASDVRDVKKRTGPQPRVSRARDKEPDITHALIGERIGFCCDVEYIRADGGIYTKLAWCPSNIDDVLLKKKGTTPRIYIDFDDGSESIWLLVGRRFWNIFKSGSWRWFSDHDDGADPMEEELVDAPETWPDRDDDDGALDFKDDEDEN